MKAGYEVTVWNRSPDKCAPLLAGGAAAGASPRDVAARSDIVFAMLADPEAAEAVACGADGVAAGARALPDPRARAAPPLTCCGRMRRPSSGRPTNPSSR